MPGTCGLTLPPPSLGRVGSSEGWFPENHVEAKRTRPLTRPRSTVSITLPGMPLSVLRPPGGRPDAARLRNAHTTVHCVLGDQNGNAATAADAPQEAEEKGGGAAEKRHVAQYTYRPKFQDELALKPGTVVLVTKQPEGGWWFGTADDKCVGLIARADPLRPIARR